MPGDARGRRAPSPLLDAPTRKEAMEDATETSTPVTERGRFRPQHGHLLIGSASVLAGAFLLVEARGYEVGSLERPGPGALPFVLCVGLIAVGALIVVTALLGRGDDDGEVADTGGNRRAVLLMLVILGFVVGVYFIGFTVSALVATYLMVHLLGSNLGVVGRLLYCFGLVLLTEAMFTLVFGISLPGSLVGLMLA